MMKKILLTFLILCLQLTAAPTQAPLLFNKDSKHIVINNRILTTVNGNAISTLDLMKKMDLLFYRQFPQYASSTEARYQFYTTQWKAVLNELIEKELIIADAKENHMEVSHGDIRQEMETLFGPNIIKSLEKAGLSYEEAWEMVKEETLIRRMIFARVNSVAIRAVTPQMVLKAYEEKTQNMEKDDLLDYRVISIRGKDSDECKTVAIQAHTLLTEMNTPPSDLCEKLSPETATINVSDTISHKSSQVSENYKTALAKLNDNSFSEAIKQSGRSGDVWRIFYLKSRTKTDIPLLKDQEAKIRNQIIDKTIAEESDKYLNKLRKHFHVLESNLSIPDGYEPFSMQ